MSPFRRKRAWWDRVPRKDGVRVQVPLGTRDERLARDISRMLDNLADPIRDFDILDLIARKRVSPAEVWDAEREGTRGALKARLLAVQVVEEDIDLSPLVDTWCDELTIKTKEDYRVQVRTLIPADRRFPRSAFVRSAIKEWLAKKPRNYRAAASGFARWLIEKDILDSNPVRLIRNKQASNGRTRHISLEEAEDLLAEMTNEDAALHAMMLGTGMEVSAALATTYADIDRQARNIHAKGTKAKHRDRVVHVTEDWCWDILEAYLRARPGVGATPVFPEDYQVIYRAFKKAVKKAEIIDYRIHDHRHTYAVWLLKRREKPELISHQLGHRDTSLLWKVYGRYVLTAEDFTEARSATPKKGRAAS